MPGRFQFGIRTLIWLTLVVAAFFAGALWQRERMKAEIADLVERALREACVSGGQGDVAILQRTTKRAPHKR